jgi:hypothetical protein
MVSHRWHWLNDGVLPLAIAILRLCWLWPWLALIQRLLTPSYTGTYLPLWSVIAFLLGARWATQIALSRLPTLRQARIWVVAVGLAAMAGLLWWHYGRADYALWDGRWLVRLAQELTHWQAGPPPPFFTLLISAGLWLRGVLDGRGPLLYDDVWSAFATGFVALALLLLAGRIDGAGLPPGTEQWILLFFGVGMGALALAGLELSNVTGRVEPKAQMRLNRYWLASVGSLIVLLLGIGLLLSAVFTPDFVARMLAWTSVLLQLVGALLGYLLIAFVYVVFLFLTPLINWIRALLSEAGPPEPVEPPDFQGQFERFAQQPGAELSPAVSEALRWLGLLGVLLVIALVIALALRYFRTSPEEGVTETRELIFSRDLLQQQLADWLRKWRNRLRWSGRGEQNPFLSLEGEVEGRGLIRKYYQALLATATALGHPRRPPQTPAEYRTTLGDSYPDRRAALNTMTSGYMQARYSPHPPPAEQIEAVRESWEQLEAEFETLLAATNGQNKAAQDGSQPHQNS